MRSLSAHLKIILAACLLLAGCSARPRDTLVIGSKNFPEQALLGEILAQHLEAQTHLRVERRFFILPEHTSASRRCWPGRIDAYVEYTGTALTAILHEPPGRNPQAVFDQVKSEYQQRFGLTGVMPSLGFNNTFAIVIRGEDARRLNVKTLSQAAAYAPQWRAGFGFEFMERRRTAMPGLARAPMDCILRGQPKILDLGLLYRALLDKQVDLLAANSTDGLIAAKDLVILEDDKHYFPPYDAVPIVRADTIARYPEVEIAIAGLAGKISDTEMQKMNYEVAGEGRDASDVARAVFALGTTSWIDVAARLLLGVLNAFEV